MAVIFASARSDENGKAYGGKAGDQKGGKEVSTQKWYKHSKGWRTFRAKDPAKARKMAKAMEMLCNTNLVGYDQHQRNTLYKALEAVGWKLEDLGKAVETDCSALIRVCCAYASIMLPDFNTANMAKALLDSGEFVELKGSKYNSQDVFLGIADIQVTQTKGHTGMILSNGSKYEGTVEKLTPDAILGADILREGDEGEAVRQMQKYLIQLGYDCGKWGADGDFGDATELALMDFQADHGCEDDGEYRPITHAAMMEALEKKNAQTSGKTVRIEGGQCWARTAPNTSGKKLGVAKKGAEFAFGGEIASNGWLLIVYKNQNAWVSDEYGKLIS